MSVTTAFDRRLIGKYDIAGPRYTSYPTAVQFSDRFAEADYRVAAAAGNIDQRPLSLYFHIPFCATVCFYCACNKIITANRRRAAPYLDRLHREIELQSALFDARRPVEQLHWGGGTPTFIDSDQMRQLMQVTGEYFRLLDDDSGEYSIEIDPREADGDTVGLLRELGFNRLSLGVQDFDSQVQQAINRIQPFEQTAAVIEAARDHHFKSIGIDLIYGLPYQTAASFDRTLDQVIELGPNRLSVFNYAHLPRLFKVQRQIDSLTLPRPSEKLTILQRVIERLTDAGYVYIGMDHFAQPDDELVKAQQQGSLYRNFQGYSTHADCDLIGFGMTSIGSVGNSYSQNDKTLDGYYAAIDQGRLPIVRGITLSDDDRLRREVIGQLICHFRLDTDVIARQYQINFNDYFANELQQLTSMAADGLLTIEDDTLEIRPAGRLLIRNICMVFDRYLPGHSDRHFSRAV